MKKNNIGVLITIIILLCISLPGAIYGTYMHHKNKALGGNPNKEFYLEGKLYFYNINKLLGTYTCETDNCGYATNSINNKEFESFNQEEREIKLINNHYAFIKDGEKIVLYDVKTSSVIINYKEVKNYSLGIENNYYLVKNESDKWGMIKVDDNITVAIPNTYSYLGLKGDITENNKYDASRVIAQTEQNWNLITYQNSIVASTNEMIIDYSSYYVITNNYKIFDYSGKSILDTYQLTDVTLLDNLAIALSSNGMYYVYDFNTSKVISTFAKTESNYTFIIENNELKVKVNDNVIKTIALS